MLAQILSRSIFTPGHGRKDSGLNMDLSPSQLVTHPTKQPPLGLEHMTPLNNEARSYGLLQDTPLDLQLLLQSTAQSNFGTLGLGAQNSTIPITSLTASVLPQISQASGLTGPFTTQAINSSLFSSHPINEDSAASNQSSLENSANPSSESLSSLDQISTEPLLFSRRDGGNTGNSPQGPPVDSSVLFRTTNTAVRQRTSQACEKCRERKTKVRRCLRPVTWY